MTRSKCDASRRWASTRRGASEAAAVAEASIFAGRPIIGIAGGIGSGKSFVARVFAELGAVVISSDDQVRDAYRQPLVKQTLRQWWGEQVLGPGGEVDRRFIAGMVFKDPAERKRLEELLHPLVHEARQKAMEQVAQDPQVKAFVWDTPLLFETGLNRQTDAVVFVDAPLEIRLQRLRQSRGWDEAELSRREKLQWPLDKKREIADYVISNTADANAVRVQVQDVLSRILHQAR
jgi:dephospho-CoA kinase